VCSAKNVFAGDVKKELGEVKTQYMPLAPLAKTDVEKYRCNISVLTT
jgi:peptide subunit release factor 1 (eRF1)